MFHLEAEHSALKDCHYFDVVKSTHKLSDDYIIQITKKMLQCSIRKQNILHRKPVIILDIVKSM